MCSGGLAAHNSSIPFRPLVWLTVDSPNITWCRLANTCRCKITARGLIEFFDLPMSVATPGLRRQPNIRLQLPEMQYPVEAASSLCFEIAYGDTLRRQAATSGLLLTVSMTRGLVVPSARINICKLLKCGRWKMDAGCFAPTNSGITGVVNQRGEIVARLPQFEAAVLRAEFAVMSGRTPYVYFGDWPVLAAVLLMLLAILGRLRRAVSRQG